MANNIEVMAVTTAPLLLAINITHLLAGMRTSQESIISQTIEIAIESLHHDIRIIPLPVEMRTTQETTISLIEEALEIATLLHHAIKIITLPIEMRMVLESKIE
jgi:hypothetical protein